MTNNNDEYDYAYYYSLLNNKDKLEEGEIKDDSKSAEGELEDGEIKDDSKSAEGDLEEGEIKDDSKSAEGDLEEGEIKDYLLTSSSVEGYRLVGLECYRENTSSYGSELEEGEIFDDSKSSEGDLEEGEIKDYRFEASYERYYRHSGAECYGANPSSYGGELEEGEISDDSKSAEGELE